MVKQHTSYIYTWFWNHYNCITKIVLHVCPNFLTLFETAQTWTWKIKKLWNFYYLLLCVCFRMCMKVSMLLSQPLRILNEWGIHTTVDTNCTFPLHSTIVWTIRINCIFKEYSCRKFIILGHQINKQTNEWSNDLTIHLRLFPTYLRICIRTYTAVYIYLH